MRLATFPALMLLLAAAAPLAGAQQAALLDDPAGDVALDLGGSPVPAVAVPALTQTLDIVSLSMGQEDEEGFDVVLGVADLDADRDLLERHVSKVHYEVRFALTGSPFAYALELTYAPFGGLEWGNPLVTPVPEVPVRAHARLVAAAAAVEDDDGAAEGNGDGKEGGGSMTVAKLPVALDFDADTLTVRVPRVALERAGPGEHLVAPMAGDALTDLAAASWAWWPAPVADAAPDSGVAEAAFAFGLDSANSLVRLAWPMPEAKEEHEAEHDEDAAAEEHEGPTAYHVPKVMPFAVNPGAPTGIWVTLENRAAEPLTVRLGAVVESEVPGFAALTAESVDLAPGQLAKVQVVATLLEPVEHRTRATAIVEGVTDAGAVARIAVPLVASAGPTAEANVLRLHSVPKEAEGLVMPLLYQQFPRAKLWMNALEADPLATDEPAEISGLLEVTAGLPMGGRIQMSGWGRGWMMDTPLARPLALEEGAPVALTVGLRSSQAEDGILRAALYQGEQLVAKGEAPASLAAGQDVAVLLEMLPEAAAFPFAEGPECLHLYVAWEPASAVDGPVYVVAQPQRTLHLLPALTQLALPLDALAEQQVGPLVAFPEPAAEAQALDSSAANERSVPGAAGALALLGLAGVALAVRRRPGA